MRYTPVADYINNYPSDEDKELIQLIHKPKWTVDGVLREPKDTFIPDYVSLYIDNGHYYYYILDAKYYCPKLYGHKILKNPGVEDVAKQYLYYMSN